MTELKKELHFIPKKYRNMVAADSYKGDREEGYWIYLQPEFYNEEMQSRTIHEYTQKDVLRVIRSSRLAAENE